MQKVTQELCIKLFNEACQNNNGIARINYHDSPDSKMQIMLISFSPNLQYNYIRDECAGKMIFTCLMGSLTIKTIDSRNSTRRNEFDLKNGESCIIERDEWRKTISGNTGAVFMEAIEGMYRSSLRHHLNECN